jgi:iron complex transport system substrate-binding protein
MNSFVAWKKRNLYHNLKRSRPANNSYDWYSSAYVYPDRILADLVKLAHPSLLPDHELYYLDRYDPQKLSFPLPDVGL